MVWTLAALCLGHLTPAASPEEVLRRYELAATIGSAQTAALVRNARLDVRWSEDGNRVVFRLDRRDGHEFVQVDTRRARRSPAFDHQRVADELTQALGRQVEPNRLPFRQLELHPEGVRFIAGGSQWLWNTRTRQLAKWSPPPPEPQATGERTGEPRDRNVSPDGRWRARIDDGVLVVQDARTQEERMRSASAGVTEVHWSPNSRFLVGYLVDRVEPGTMTNVESLPRDSLRPRVRTYPYDLPGDPVSKTRMVCLDVELRTETLSDAEPINIWGPSNFRWRQDARRFTFERRYRGFQRESIVEVDAATGRSRNLLDEVSETFVFPAVRFVQYLDDTNEILWTSDRDNWNHIYLFDSETGELKQQITQGPWVVREVREVDVERREILFAAGGKEPDRNPYNLHFYRIGFDGQGLVRLTPGDGHHQIAFSPDRRFYVNTHSRADLPPVHELRRTKDGSLVAELARADASALLATGWRMPEEFVAKGRDGVTDIWGVIYRPSHLDRTLLYPIVEDIYAGPQGSSVPAGFRVATANQALAELGFIVVVPDGMGMGHRSKAFHNVSYRNLGDSGFPDRILWFRAAAERYPYIDPDNVGIFGVSAGGYNAARALIVAPEVYKAAFAVCGNHDHRTDKLWWNELWMGYPVGPHYEEQSNVAQAHRIQGRLFLVHGELDDNVNPFASTMQMVRRLIDANKDFDMLLVPGAGHSFGSYERRRMWDFFVKHLRGEQPPREFDPRRTATDSLHFTVHNKTAKPITLYWIPAPGQRRPYQTIEPGQSARQHSFNGHQWEAVQEGRAVSWYTVDPAELEWIVLGNRSSHLTQEVEPAVALDAIP